MTAYQKPLPRIDYLTKPFWANLNEGRLTVQKCDACEDQHYPPSPVCPNCLSKDQQWVEVSGRGSLESWISFHRAYWTSFAEDLPYSVCLVKLEEGPLLVSNLVGDTSGARLGARVELVLERVNEEITLPKFRLMGG